jgi:hypothetical protein
MSPLKADCLIIPDRIPRFEIESKSARYSPQGTPKAVHLCTSHASDNAAINAAIDAMSLGNWFMLRDSFLLIIGIAG